MKKGFLRSMLALGTIFAIVNCSETANDTISNNIDNAESDQTQQVQPTDPASSNNTASTLSSTSSASIQLALSSATVQPRISSANVQPGASSASVQPNSSESAQPRTSSANIQPNSSESTQLGTSSSSVEAASSSDTAKIESSSSNNSQTQSCSSSAESSSSIKSSSSSAKSSSSAIISSCPNIQVIKGGWSGSGWASRYWDCCKPHCSNTSYHSRQCTNKGKTESTDWDAGSICNGGTMMACTSQIPFTIDGCDEMGFAFAAVPAADGGSCGKCYQLTFTGKGKYESDLNTTAIKGKKLIIMTTNIGDDVQQGLFDIMIPGGGVGKFNGCGSIMGWGSQGEQYGGLLSACEMESRYNAMKYVNCLIEKCNIAFSNDNEAKQGCLFLAVWMHAAGNPMHNYVEVECPQELIDRF